MFAYVRFMSAVAGVALFAASWGWNSGRSFQREQDEKEAQEASEAIREVMRIAQQEKAQRIIETPLPKIPESELDSSNDSTEI